MKQFFTIGILCILMSFWCVTSYANNVSVSIGLRSWINSWEIEGWGEEYVSLIGPSIKISSGNFFGGIISLNGRYRYERFVAEGVDTDEYEVVRNDTDIVIGYMLNRRFGIIGGYKYINNFVRSNVYDSYSGTVSRNFSWNISGPAFGLMFNLPFGEMPLVFVASTSYMPSLDVRSKILDIEEIEEMNGFTAELGLAYSLFNRFALSVGYKYQSLESDSDTPFGDLEFSGFTIGAIYQF